MIDIHDDIPRTVVACLEIQLIGLDIALAVISTRKRRWDAVIAETSYAMYVLFAVLSTAGSFGQEFRWSIGWNFMAAILGICGLFGIVKSMTARSPNPSRAERKPANVARSGS